jgi:hypothetical protein
MKKLCVVVALLIIFSVAGSCANIQRSSMEEAQFVVRSLPDFKKEIQYFSVESWAIAFPVFPGVYQSTPELIKGRTHRLIHVIIYKTKANDYKLLLLDDSRPPKIIATKQFK